MELRASQLVVEMLVAANLDARAGQLGVEMLVDAELHARVSFFVAELLQRSYVIPMPALYPALPGLTYSVIKRPKFFTGIAKSTSGREVRVAYAQYPLWEWDLTYNYLPDQRTASSATDTDMRTLVGFFLSQSGALQSFRFEDPDDHAVTEQVIGVTDGTTTNYILQRTWGLGDNVAHEPIGWLNLAQPVHFYLDGVLVDPSLYEVLSTIGTLQQISFQTAPAAGKVVTVTMAYYYNVRFSADTYDFEKFMDKLWSTQTITLVSQRA